MAISNVKSALMTDLATLTIAKGYSTTIKTFYKVPKMPKDVDVTKCPALSLFISDAPQDDYTESEMSFSLNYTLIIYVSSNDDTDESGDSEDALCKIYEDVVTLFNKQTTTTYKLDEVQTIEILGFFPEVAPLRAWAYVPIKITYNK